MRFFFVVLQWLGIIAIVHALMLLGADEITTIERGGIRTIRSLGTILTLYGIDPAPWMAGALPGLAMSAMAVVLSAPAWLILFLVGGALTLFTRKHG